MIKKLIYFLLSVVMILGTSMNAFASTIDKSAQNNVQVKEITRDEYLKTYAELHGVSIVEADKIDKAETKKNLAMETAQARNIGERITSRATVYKQVTRGFNVGSSGNFNSVLAVVIQVKLNRYNSTSYGDYQKFAQVLDKGADIAGSGTATLSKIAFSAEITKDSAYGNSLYMMFSGNVVHAISRTFTTGASGAGFTLSQTSGSTYYYRKLAQFDYTFSSNWDLS